jgi:hypothetical protein
MMAVNDVSKIALVHSLVGADGDIVVTHHYRQTTDGNGKNPAAIQVALANAWLEDAKPEWLLSLSDRVVLETIQVRGVSEPLFGVDIAVGEAGDLPPVGLGNAPYRTAPVVSLRTGLIGRSYRGRNFLPPPNETDIENGILESILVTLIETYYANAMTINFADPALDEWKLTVYSPTLSLINENVTDNLVTNVIVRPVAGSQRGRQSVT